MRTVQGVFLMTHDVHEDTHGYEGAKEYPRIWCATEECHGACIIRQPFVDDIWWKNITDRFRATHPEESMKLQHRVQVNEDYTRCVCVDPDCRGREGSVLERPVEMNDLDWQEAFKAFAKRHPHRAVHRMGPSLITA